MTNTPAVRVRLKFKDLDTFVERFAANVTRGGVFIASRSPRPVGDSFPFEVQLAGGEIALAGEGKVIWVKEYNPDEPSKPHGMGVQFTRVDPGSRETLNRILRVKGAGQAGAGPRPPSQPVRPIGSHGTTNGTGAKPHVDTSVDLDHRAVLGEHRVERDQRRVLGARDRTETRLIGKTRDADAGRYDRRIAAEPSVDERQGRRVRQRQGIGRQRVLGNCGERFGERRLGERTKVGVFPGLVAQRRQAGGAERGGRRLAHCRVSRKVLLSLLVACEESGLTLMRYGVHAASAIIPA